MHDEYLMKQASTYCIRRIVSKQSTIFILSMVTAYNVKLLQYC